MVINLILKLPRTTTSGLSFILNKNTTYEAFAFSVVRPYSTLKITFKQELFIQLSKQMLEAQGELEEIKIVEG